MCSFTKDLHGAPIALVNTSQYSWICEDDKHVLPQMALTVVVLVERVRCR